MIYYKRLIFNPLQVNCWLVYSDDGSCLVFDPSCSNDAEKKELSEFLSSENLKPMAVISTHGHFDHVPGVSYLKEKYGIPYLGHAEDREIIAYAAQQAKHFGLDFGSESIDYDQMLSPDKPLHYGEIRLEVLHVPGHSSGSLAFYSAEAGFVIVGDVLFRGSIGRTDLPGGNYEQLIGNIREKLLVLPEPTRVLPGHGPETTIGIEKKSNPFLV